MPPSALAFDPGYWLAHCEGFRVRSSGGHLGFVEELELDPVGRPRAIAVRAGHLVVLVIPVEEIQTVFPERELIVVDRHAPQSAADPRTNRIVLRPRPAVPPQAA